MRQPPLWDYFPGVNAIKQVIERSFMICPLCRNMHIAATYFQYLSLADNLEEQQCPGDGRVERLHPARHGDMHALGRQAVGKGAGALGFSAHHQRQRR